MPTLDAPRALQTSQRIWDQEILPALYEYIRGGVLKATGSGSITGSTFAS